MGYVEVVPTKINSGSPVTLNWLQVDDSGDITQNYNLKINTRNLNNLAIFLFTVPGELTPMDLTNVFKIGNTTFAPKVLEISYGRSECKAFYNLPIDEYKQSDGYIYCGYTSTNGHSRYWTAFAEFPPVPTPINVQVTVAETP